MGNGKRTHTHTHTHTQSGADASSAKSDPHPEAGQSGYTYSVGMKAGNPYRGSPDHLMGILEDAAGNSVEIHRSTKWLPIHAAAGAVAAMSLYKSDGEGLEATAETFAVAAAGGIAGLAIPNPWGSVELRQLGDKGFGNAETLASFPITKEQYDAGMSRAHQLAGKNRTYWLPGILNCVGATCDVGNAVGIDAGVKDGMLRTPSSVFTQYAQHSAAEVTSKAEPVLKAEPVHIGGARKMFNAIADRSGWVGGLALGTGVLALGGTYSDAANMAIPGVSAADAAAHGRTAEATVQGIDEIVPFSSEVLRPLAHIAGMKDVDPGILESGVITTLDTAEHYYQAVKEGHLGETFVADAKQAKQDLKGLKEEFNALTDAGADRLASAAYDIAHLGESRSRPPPTSPDSGGITGWKGEIGDVPVVAPQEKPATEQPDSVEVEKPKPVVRRSSFLSMGM